MRHDHGVVYLEYCMRAARKVIANTLPSVRVSECADLAMGKYSGMPPPVGTERPRRRRLSSKRDEVALLVQ